jgi:thiamine biosynthesis lipoprotein
MRHAEHVMGTVVSFDLRPGDLDHQAVREALSEACAALHRADAVFSMWKPDSALRRMRRGELDLGQAPACVAEVLDRCAEARRLSGGWFDPWSLPGGVDPTGLVKGWAGERALGRLKAAGLAAAMVNAGGDVAAFGRPEPGRPWRIGVRDPRPAGGLVAVLDVEGAIATSGHYERGPHVLDPWSGEPARGVLSATVTGPELGLADALATGLFAGGEHCLSTIAALEDHRYLAMLDDGRVLATGEAATALAAC